MTDHPSPPVSRRQAALAAHRNPRSPPRQPGRIHRRMARGGSGRHGKHVRPEAEPAFQDGQIVEMDGKPSDEFDFLDPFIAERAIDIAVAEDSMALAVRRDRPHGHRPSDAPQRSARGHPRTDSGQDPGRHPSLNVVEIMMGLQKMRARRTPANQAHSTSARDNPIQVAADAAEAALRGFAELETTLGVVRYAPLVALALQIGSQAGRAGVLTQCALEEATELELGMRGFTTYAETISIYGTEKVFVDGDDTPVVEDVPRLRLRLARHQDALHLRHRLGGADGQRRRPLHALPGDPLHPDGPRRRRAGPAERLDQLHRRARRGAGAASGPCRGEPRRAPCATWSVASGNDQSFSHSSMRRVRAADAAAAARHRLRLLRLLRGAEHGQHVRRLQLRHRRLRRLEHHPARPAGRRRSAPRAGRRDPGRPRPGGRGAAGAVPVPGSAVDHRSGNRGGDLRQLLRTTTRCATCSTTSRARSRSWSAGSPASTWSRRLEAGGFRDVAENLLTCCASASPATCCRPQRSSTPRTSCRCRAINDANDYAGPGTGYRLRASAGNR